MSELRTRMIDDMTLRGLAAKTQDSYLRAVTGLAGYHHRSPDGLTDREVQAYLLYLMRERNLSWSSVNVTLAGLRFFYHQTLAREKTTFHIPGPRKPSKLPEVLSQEEVARLFAHTSLPRHRVLLMTAYGAGLRVGEVVRLRVQDIDSDRMTIRVEQGKGAQDRYSLLSPRLLEEMRGYWKLERPFPWLFPTRGASRPMHYGTVERIYIRTKKRAGITKAGNIHALRHAFATHLLESGQADLHTIQRLLGHRHITTTMRYLHLARKNITDRSSPLDLLNLPEPTSR
ncbi:MAG: tyrosine-type recombinase/integrase [Gemmatimonadales bacterium]